jgi:hypothetical protein
MKKVFVIFALMFVVKISQGQQPTKNQLDYFGMLTSLMEIKNNVSESFYLTQSWAFIDKKSETPAKQKLKYFCQNSLINLNEKIKLYYYLLDTSDIVSLLKIKENINELTDYQLHIMNTLNSFEAYDNPLIIFEIVPSVEYGGALEILTDSITRELELLIQKKSSEYTELIENQYANQSGTETLKTKRIKQLLDILHASDEIENILKLSNKYGLNKNNLKENIYDIMLKKYDKYYTLNEIEDIIDFYKTKTGKRMINVSKKMMMETLTEILGSLK